MLLLLRLLQLLLLLRCAANCGWPPRGGQGDPRDKADAVRCLLLSVLLLLLLHLLLLLLLLHLLLGLTLLHFLLLLHLLLLQVVGLLLLIRLFCLMQWRSHFIRCSFLLLKTYWLVLLSRGPPGGPRRGH